MKYLESQGLSERNLLPLFYAYARVMKRHGSKYVSKKTLSEISTDINCERLQAVVKSTVYSIKLPIKRFCRLVRVLLHYFLSHVSHLTVFASSRLSKNSHIQHLKRRRQIQGHLEQEYRRLRTAAVENE